MIKEFKDIDKLSDSNFEWFVKELLEKSGWTNAIITEVGKEYRFGDGGIDIFAYKAGRKFAIEVKQRNIKTNVDVKALNQLVTGAKLAKVNNMILVTNAYFTSEVHVRALRLGVELIDRDELQNLWVKNHSEIGREIKPRKYQAQVIEDAINFYHAGKNKMLIEMATGLGKTYTVALLVKELIKQFDHHPKILFVAHQIEILVQSATAFKNVFGIGTFSFSACFAGTAPENTDFIFASFDTLYAQLDTLKKESFDIIIVDEAHHVPAITYSEVIRNFSPKLLIGLTATPFRTDGKSVTEFFGGVEGHIGKYDLVWALKHRKLAFPKYLVLLDDLDKDKIKQLDNGLSIDDLDKRLFLHKKDEEVVKIIERTIHQKNICHVKGIVFCRNIRHLNHLLGFFKMGSAIGVHSKMSAQERRDNIRNFREGNYRYILVCDLFNEGIDIPETNLLVFMRYTGSKTIWLQQLGRGLRKTPNKEYVHILDFVGSLERLYEVKALSNAVKKQKLDQDNLIDTKQIRDKSQIIHDGELEVHYNESAARVLELIEKQKYRLKTREVLLEKVRNYYGVHGFIPSVEQIENCLDDVSVDQISTYFDSYYGYLSVAFYDDFDKQSMQERIYHYVERYLSKYGMKPSPRAISINLSFNSLIEFTEEEIVALTPKVGSICPQAVADESPMEAPKGVVKNRASALSIFNIRI